MFSNSFNRDESGQTALETAIILIAFVVVASVFAFTILSAGSSSTEKGEEAIYAGLESVQSSMSLKGAVIAQGDMTTVGSEFVKSVTFSLSLVSGGDPVDLTDTTSSSNVVVIDYRDDVQIESNIGWKVSAVVGDLPLLEDGEMFEIVVDLSTLTTKLEENSEFTLEVKPPTGAVIGINRTTPAAVSTVMELR